MPQAVKQIPEGVQKGLPQQCTGPPGLVDRPPWTVSWAGFLGFSSICTICFSPKCSALYP